MSSRQTVDVAPYPSALIESLRSIGYTLETALADIIDNCITARASQISILFRWDDGAPWVAITDNGCGMSAVELTAAMRFGSASPLDKRDKNDLGRFGLGMKTASISQCRHLTVASRRDNKTCAREWDLGSMALSKSNEWSLGQMDDEDIRSDQCLSDLIAKKIASLESGTVVLWRNFDISLVGGGKRGDERRFDELLDSARTHLETVFHRFLTPDPGHSSIRIDFNGSHLKAFNPFGPSIPARQELPEEVINLEKSTIRVQPYVLPHRSKVAADEYRRCAGEDGYLHSQGFYIYRQRRLIVKATWFRLIRKEELNKLIRVRVDIPNSLDHLWNINVNKSQVRPPESVRKELKKIIKRIEGAGKLVYMRKATKMQNPNRVPVWRREVSDGKIRYRINQEHPLLKGLLDDVHKEVNRKLISGLSLIEQAFPFDACHADVANEDNEIEEVHSDEETIRDVCLQVLDALRACGFDGDELRHRLLRTEIPGVTEEMINHLLEENDNG